jgi:catechol 2,3-dioxygenase-like lactoylglutathione lyase family enzyme
MSGPISLGHIGLCVSDLDAAVNWYQDVFDLELLHGPTDLTVAEPRPAKVLGDVFGPTFRHARVAQLGFGGDVGLELFAFITPPTRDEVSASYFDRGFSHLCFTAQDIEDTLARALQAGATARTAIWHEREGRPYRFVHLEDPFGNLLELHSHPNREQVLGVVGP